MFWNCEVSCRIGCRSGKHSEGYAKCVSGYCQGSPISVLGNFLQTPTTLLVHFTHYPFWENSCKRQQQIHFTHFGKVLANANQKYQFISRQIHFRSLEGQSKKKQWMFAVHHFCSNGEENSFQVWGDGTCSHTETQRLKVGTQNKDLCVFTNSAIIHLNYFSRTHFTTFFSIWTTWAASESSGGCAMPCRTLTVWGRLT